MARNAVVCHQGLSLCLPPVVLGEVVENVHLVIVLQQAVGGADVVVLQDGTVVVQDGRVRPARTRPLATQSLYESNAQPDLRCFNNTQTTQGCHLITSASHPNSALCSLTGK